MRPRTSSLVAKEEVGVELVGLQSLLLLLDAQSGHGVISSRSDLRRRRIRLDCHEDIASLNSGDISCGRRSSTSQCRSLHKRKCGGSVEHRRWERQG